MKKYEVTFHGCFGYSVEVEANNENEAKEKAEKFDCEADCGDLAIELYGEDIEEKKEEVA